MTGEGRRFRVQVRELGLGLELGRKVKSKGQKMKGWSLG